MPKLTKSIVDRAEVPPKGQAFVWCSEDRGFGVRINASGSRTFIAQGRINGKERRVSIGRPGVFSVDQARAQARELLRGMRLGVDPVEEKARTECAVLLSRAASRGRSASGVRPCSIAVRPEPQKTCAQRHLVDISLTSSGAVINRLSLHPALQRDAER